MASSILELLQLIAHMSLLPLLSSNNRQNPIHQPTCSYMMTLKDREHPPQQHSAPKREAFF